MLLIYEEAGKDLPGFVLQSRLCILKFFYPKFHFVNPGLVEHADLKSIYTIPMNSFIGFLSEPQIVILGAKNAYRIILNWKTTSFCKMKTWQVSPQKKLRQTK